ncbi:hypothetical protein [Kaarinaea lacus]
MNSKTAKLISPERVVELFDCYGANPEAWPDDERSTALVLIQHSTELQNLQREAGQLDKLLTSGVIQQEMNEPVDLSLVSRIVDNLPAQEKVREHVAGHGNAVAKRTFFDFGNWASMVAASIAVFVITVSIMDLHPSSTAQRNSDAVQTELDYWMWQQVTGEIDNDEEEPLTMMALFELE